LRALWTATESDELGISATTLTPFFCCCCWMIDLFSNSRHLLIATVTATETVVTEMKFDTNKRERERERLDYLRRRRSIQDAWVWVRVDRSILRRSCIRRRWGVYYQFSVTHWLRCSGWSCLKMLLYYLCVENKSLMIVHCRCKMFSKVNIHSTLYLPIFLKDFVVIKSLDVSIVDWDVKVLN